MAGFFSGCNPGKKEASKLNIVLFGYDSIASYYGNSAEMTDLRYGKLTDSLFMDTVLTAAKEREPGIIILKPVSGGGVLSNWQHVDTLFKINNFNNRIIDTLDKKEQEFFNTTSIIPFIKSLHEEPLKLFLPKEESEQVHEPSGKELIVLILNENEVYAYNGAQVKDGKRYTYNELGLYMAKKKSNRDFFVVIKPSEKSTYKSTVDMLELMTVKKVRNYKMEDPTKAEQALINELLNKKVE